PEMIEVTNAKVDVAKEKLKEARTRQKSYVDKHRRALEFQPCNHVFLKVSPARGVRRFGIKGKLSPRFIRPFEILDRVGEVSYRLALPPSLSHVHDVFHVSLLRGFFGGIIPSGKPLGKPRSLSGLLIDDTIGRPMEESTPLTTNTHLLLLLLENLEWKVV
nr:putative nucleotidyltransferase, ribonuclease H [Tanacetum cinerariifolium]